MNMTSSNLRNIEVLFFDVFGTVVDWRSGIEDTLRSHASQALEQAAVVGMPEETRQRAECMRPGDWASFATEWRQLYYLFCKQIALDPSIPYKTIDEHFAESIRQMVAKWEIQGLWTEAQMDQISKAWHRLPPWADTSTGIRKLNEDYQTATLANGNTELQQDLSAFADLRWTHCFGANVFQSYKPSSKVYLGAAARLGQRPEACALVAAHLKDLDAARKLGFKTIYVERHLEESLDDSEVQAIKDAGWVDLWVTSSDNGFLEVAEKLSILRAS